MTSFDENFRNNKTAAAPVETREAEWHEFLPGMAKMLGLVAVGLVVDAVVEGLTGAKTNFASMASVGGTAWYVFGPGSPDPKTVEGKPQGRASTAPTP